MKLRRMCGGPCWPWRRGSKGRFGLLMPRRASGALIIDNLGLAVVYSDPNGEW